MVVIVLKTGEREDRYESTIADLKARLKNVGYFSCFIPLLYVVITTTAAGLSSRVVSTSDCGVRGPRFESRC